MARAKKKKPATKKSAVKKPAKKKSAVKSAAKKKQRRRVTSYTEAERTLVRTLDAGGLLHPGAKLPRGEAVDRVGSRAYRHPALGERAVVRLCSEALARGEDLEMELQGFGAPKVGRKVALRRQRSLGFPGWALVHDPEHASFALEVVADLRQATRRARTKPGHAWDALVKIAKRLEQSVPSFLPSFWEQAGRSFLDEGNQHYGARAFGKARAAELAHGLEVEESHRQQTYLEFALAGALSLKDLRAYAAELARSREPDHAYECFRELVVRRVLGGLAPYKGMERDVRGLATAAGLDADAEDRSLFGEIIDSPSVLRTGKAFWHHHRAHTVELARDRNDLRVRLLDAITALEGGIGYWLGVLEDAGALEALASPTALASALPAGGPAGWLSEVVFGDALDAAEDIPTQVLDLLEKMAPLLRAEGAVPMADGGSSGLDLDLYDRALELGLPMEPPPAHFYFDLVDWAKARSTGAHGRGRDPVHVAGDPHFRPALMRGMDDAGANELLERMSGGVTGLTEVRRDWLLATITGLTAHALPEVDRLLDDGPLPRLQRDTMQAVPEAWQALQQVSLVDPLLRTLRAGIMDEYGWPELEQALEDLQLATAAVDGEDERVGGAFPHLILANGERVVVLGPTGRLLEHELRLPAGDSVQLLRYSQGQLLVGYEENYWSEATCYWSSNPRDTFEMLGNKRTLPSGHALLLNDGSVSYGGRALHAHDTELEEQGSVFWDGATVWRSEWSTTGGEVLREYDPRSGETGRLSWPAWLAEFIDADHALDADDCALFALPAELASSPLGSRDGLTGWRCRRVARGPLKWRFEGEGIDGRRHQGDLGGHRPVVVGMLAMPGRQRHLCVTASYHSDDEYELWESTTRDRVSVIDREQSPGYCSGTRKVPPLRFWHYLTPRDEAGSRALAAIDRDVVAQLLPCAVAELGDAVPPEVDLDRFTATAARIAALVPQITDSKLARGVLGVVVHAAQRQQQVIDLQRALDPEGEGRPEPEHKMGELELERIFQGLAPNAWGVGSLDTEIATALRFLETGERPRALETSGWGWPTFVGRIGWAAWQAIAPLTSAEARQVATAFLRAWLAHGIPAAREGMHLCVLHAEETSLDQVLPGEGGASTFHEQGGTRLFGRQFETADQGQVWVCLARTEGGEVELPTSASLLPEARAATKCWGSPQQIERLLELAAERDPLPLDPEAAALLCEATGMSAAEAGLIQAGFAGALGARWQWEPDKEARAALGLKLREAKAAGALVKDTDIRGICRAIDAAIPEDLADLWAPAADEHSFARRLAAEWGARFGQRIRIDVDLLDRVDRELGEFSSWSRSAKEDLVALHDVAGDPAYAADRVWFATVEGWAARPEPPGFDGDTLAGSVVLFPYLFHELPVGDPLRGSLPAAWRAVLERLSADGLVFPLGLADLEDDETVAAHLLERVGGEQVAVTDESGNPSDAGAWDGGLLLTVQSELVLRLMFRPARIADERDVAELAALQRSYPEWYGGQELAHTLLMRSPGFAAMAERVEDTPVPPGAFETNPLHSVPELVAQVQAELGLEAAAACYYLQLLTCHRPTRQAVRRSNGWSARALAQAGEQLVEKGLVVAGKRPRAGRELFLPGGWENHSAPDLPLETWKLPLYGMTRPEHGLASPPLGRILPLQPIHQLFARAWQRVQDGDPPTYV